MSDKSLVDEWLEIANDDLNHRIIKSQRIKRTFRLRLQIRLRNARQNIDIFRPQRE